MKMTVKVNPENKDTSKIKLMNGTPAPKTIGSISIKDKDLPEIANWTVGQEYTLEVKVRLKGSRMERDWSIDNDKDKKEYLSGEFDILSATTEEKEESK